MIKNPKDTLSVFIAPVYKFLKKYLSNNAIYKYCHKFADFVFKKSSDMSMIMILLNGLAIYLSHNAQIKGLEKSNRENKDFLIRQEKVEKRLDLVCTLIPPVLIDNFFQKKLESGKLITRMTEKNLKYKIAPAAGVNIDELGDISHIIPFSKIFKNSLSKLGLYINKITKSQPKQLWDKIKLKAPDLNEAVPAASIFDIAIAADVASNKKIEGLYNQSAYDETVGQIDGLRKILSILSLIVISYVIMPVIKNKIANYSYKKYLEKIGETPETMKRKKLYNSLKPIDYNNNKDIFKKFNKNDEDESPPDLLRYKNLRTEKPNDKIFGQITSYGRNSSQSTGLRI